MAYDLDTVIETYKARKTERAVTGWIPMTDFEVFEKDIRPAMRERGFRVRFRGPRPQRLFSTTTLRKNATHAVIY